MTTPTPENRQVRRSRQALFDALRELLAERDFATITVGDIAEHANVGRTTFYRHFDDKMALLLELHAEMYRERQLAPTAREEWLSSGAPTRYVALLDRIEGYRQQQGFRLSMGQGFGQLEHQIQTIMREQVAQGLQSAFGEPPNAPLLLVAHQVAGIIEATFKWQFYADGQSTEVTARQLQQSIRAIVISAYQLETTES